MHHWVFIEEMMSTSQAARIVTYKNAKKCCAQIMHGALSIKMKYIAVYGNWYSICTQIAHTTLSY